MKDCIIKIFTGILINILLILGMKLWFSPSVVRERNLRNAEDKLTEADVPDLIPVSYKDTNKNIDLLLVNKEHTAGKDFMPDIIPYKDTDVMMNRSITDSYKALSEAVTENTGDKLYVMSSYRSYDDQERVYNEEGSEIAAVPGTSEHQTGLALDVYVSMFAGAGFIQSNAGKFVNEHCYEYGFIIRYPYGMEDVTGFKYEPWHIRYVGLPHSMIIKETGIVLEDYGKIFEDGVYYRYDDYLIARMKEDDLKVPRDPDDISISPDGTGYVFVTVRTEER